MKASIFILFGIVIILAIWLAVPQFSYFFKSAGIPPKPSKEAIATANTYHPQPAPPDFVATTDWRKLHVVREKTLKCNPELAAEYKELQKEMYDHQQEEQAKTIRFDPVLQKEQVQDEHAAVLDANPGLQDQARQISEKMHAFQEKLNAAMVKTDPSIAPLVAKLSGKTAASEGSARPITGG